MHNKEMNRNVNLLRIAVVVSVLLLAGAALVLVLRNNGNATSSEATDRTAAYPEEPEITGATWPTALSNGQSFGLRGRIVCRYPLTEVRGTVTNRVTGETIFDVRVHPDGYDYAIGSPVSEPINDGLIFNSPACSNSWLNYQLTALYEKNGETLSKVLLDRNFTVGNPMGEEPAA